MTVQVLACNCHTQQAQHNLWIDWAFFIVGRAASSLAVPRPRKDGLLLCFNRMHAKDQKLACKRTPESARTSGRKVATTTVAAHR